MNKTYYQLELEELKNIGSNKKILLHSCCAPCSSHVISVLTNYADITILYYNPNIDSNDEYQKRLGELERFVKEFKPANSVKVISIGYNSEDYLQEIEGLEEELEGGRRCYKCFNLRLEKTCIYAKEHNFDYFTTTLTISPLKNSQTINEIGHILENKYKVSYLYSDFKKRDGYKRSIVLSHEYNLYRQDYCGCKFSKRRKVEE